MPSALEDPTQPPHYRDVVTPELEPYTVILKDGQTAATIYPISSPENVPVGLLAFLCDEFNAEIERGDTYPLFDTLHIDTFQNYWFGAFAGVMLIGGEHNLEERRQWEKECLGTFYIKPNYPGRCSHICTAGFLVNAGIRRQGIGRTLTEAFLEWAPKLGYTYSIFNLVFDTNAAAKRIYETLAFQRIGRIKGAGILKGHEDAVDALIYGKQLVDAGDESLGEERFDKIKYYLETGKYPPNSDRQGKSRLRSSAAHYVVQNGVLMLKGREVVGDPERQLQIATDLHMQNHAGINKTTSQITEKYHWTRIKETVAQAIRNCSECREAVRPATKRVKKESYQPAPGDHLTQAAVAAASHDDHHHHHHHQQQHHHQQHNHIDYSLQHPSESSLLGTALENIDEQDLIANIRQHHQNDGQNENGSSSQLLKTESTAHVDPQIESAFAAAAAAAAGSGHDHNDYSIRHNDQDQTSGSQHDDGSGGDEIAIARALLQANNDGNDQDGPVF